MKQEPPIAHGVPPEFTRKMHFIFGLSHSDSYHPENTPRLFMEAIKKGELDREKVLAEAIAFGRRELVTALGGDIPEKVLRRAKRLNDLGKRERLAQMLHGDRPYEPDMARALVEAGAIGRGLHAEAEILRMAVEQDRREIIHPVIDCLPRTEKALNYYCKEAIRAGSTGMLKALMAQGRQNDMWAAMIAHLHANGDEMLGLAATRGDHEMLAHLFNLDLKAKDPAALLEKSYAGSREAAAIVLLNNVELSDHPYLAPVALPVKRLARTVSGAATEFSDWLLSRRKREGFFSARGFLQAVGGLFFACGGLMGGMTGFTLPSFDSVRNYGLLPDYLAVKIVTGIGGLAAGAVGAPLAVMAAATLCVVAAQAVFVAPRDAFRGLKLAGMHRGFVKGQVAPVSERLGSARDPGGTVRSFKPDALVAFIHGLSLFRKIDEDTVAARMRDALLNDHPRALARAIDAGAPMDNRIVIGDFTGSAVAYCTLKNRTRCLKVLLDAGALAENPADAEKALDIAIDTYRPTAARMLAQSATSRITPERVHRAEALMHLDIRESLVVAADLRRIDLTGKWERLEAEAGALKQRVGPAFSVAAVSAPEAAEELPPPSSSPQAGRRLGR